jgi:hypothetical protein
MTINEIYQSEIKSLSQHERLLLMELLARDLAHETPPSLKQRSNIFQLRGHGKEIWKDINVEEYIKNSREERDIVR